MNDQEANMGQVEVEPLVDTKPLPTINSLTVDEYTELQLKIARQQREEAQAEEYTRLQELEHAHRLQKEVEEKARELPAYNFRLRYMTMFSVTNVGRVFGFLLLATGLLYVSAQAIQGNNVFDPGRSVPTFVLEVYLPLGILFALMGVGSMVYIIVIYRYARVSIEDGFFVYTPPRIPWMLLFGGEKSAKKITLRQAATADFQQNPIESLFNMDSTSFVLDTAAKEASVFKKLRGIPRMDLLEQHLARAV